MYNSKCIEANEVDPFWNDCFNNNYTVKACKNDLKENHKIINDNIKKHDKFKNQRKIKNKLLKKIYINNSDAEYYKPRISSTTHTPIHMGKNVTEALKKEELIPIKKHKKQEKLNKIFNDLYSKNKANIDLKQKNNINQKQMLENSKVSNCTFKPKICLNKRLERKINRLFSDSNIYERNIKLQQKHNEKVAYMYNEVNKIGCDDRKEKCLFHPMIKNKNIKKMFYDESVWKNKMDNDSNKLFLLRYMKAREEEFIKREILNSPVNLKFTLRKNFSCPRKMVRVLSEKDSLLIRKKLHNTLNSLNNLFMDDEIEDNEINESNKIEKDNNSVNVRRRIDNLQLTFAKKNQI
jgi:hypothetical protein